LLVRFVVDGNAALCHYRKNLFGLAAIAEAKQIMEKLR
jgi:hypothetical protein